METLRNLRSANSIGENLISANKEPMKEPLYVKFVSDIMRDLLGFPLEEQNDIIRLLKHRLREERDTMANRLHEQGQDLIEEAKHIYKSSDDIATL